MVVELSDNIDGLVHMGQELSANDAQTPLETVEMLILVMSIVQSWWISWLWSLVANSS